MQLYKQIGLSFAPIIGAFLVYSSLISQSQVEADMNASQIEAVEQQFNVLEIKLKQRHKLMAKQKSINKEIKQLRNSVPEKPDLDLLMIDLVKICDSNSVTLLGVEVDDPKGRAKKKKGLIASLVKEVGGKMPKADKGKKAGKRVKKKSKEEANMDLLGLKHETRRVYITGKFNGLVGVLNNLEKYQRIVGIRDLIIANPEDQDKEVVKTIASEKGKELGLEYPVMTFLLHIYYLPS